MNVQNQPKGSRERTLHEVKTEFMRRAGKLNPFEDIKPEDAERVMAALKNLDKDHWARSGAKSGTAMRRKAMPRPKPAQGQGTRRSLHARVRRLPRRPLSVANSPGKLNAYPIRCACSARQPSISIRARSHRSAVRRQEARRLSAETAWRGKATGRPALGRRRWLEGRPAEDRQGCRRDADLASLTIDMPGFRREPGDVPAIPRPSALT